MIHCAETWYRPRPDSHQLASLASHIELSGEAVPAVLASHLATVADLLPADRYAEACPRWHWHRYDVSPVPRIPTGQHLGTPLEVFVNDGRWLVQCPCGGAQYASKGDHRFFCIDCLNEWCGGLWAATEWPDDHPLIEAVLDQRPTNRAHWNLRAATGTGSTETLAGLVAENDEIGSPVPDHVRAAVS
ncbi:MAG: hypothetical protein ACYDA6_00095 [Solirubrobacteraceae bacterium]